MSRPCHNAVGSVTACTFFVRDLAKLAIVALGDIKLSIPGAQNPLYKMSKLLQALHSVELHSKTMPPYPETLQGNGTAWKTFWKLSEISAAYCSALVNR